MIYVCTNKETVAEHVEHDSHEVCNAVAEMFLENLGRVMEDTEYDTESSFAAWHGGRMVQHHKVMGLVAYDPEDAALAGQIYDAIHGELVRLVELEAASEPLSDDTIHCCPNCERPNQFGELCWGCQRDAEEEGLRWHDDRESAGPIGW